MCAGSTVASGGQAYRLLSEAEWEYVARAGTTTAFSTGAMITPAQAQYKHSLGYAGSPVLESSPGRTVPVGSFPANAFKLHDMHGNVSEWVEDCVGDYSATDGQPVEAQGCTIRVIRGGNYNEAPSYLRSAQRRWEQPTFFNLTLGFRVARTP